MICETTKIVGKVDDEEVVLIGINHFCSWETSEKIISLIKEELNYECVSFTITVTIAEE